MKLKGLIVQSVRCEDVSEGSEDLSWCERIFLKTEIENIWENTWILVFGPQKVLQWKLC